MDNDMKTFVVEGIQRYGEAQSTLRAFEEELCELLKHVLKDRGEWKGFVPSTSETDLNAAPYSPRHEPYVAAYLAGKLKDGSKATFELGVWWDPKKIGRELPVVLYANCDSDSSACRFDYSGQKGRIQPQTKRQPTRLWMAPKPEQDLHEDLLALVVQVDEHLAKMLGKPTSD